MKRKLDLDNWDRKEHFEFFSKIEEPFFGFTVNIDCTGAYKKAKALNVSFFIYYLHKTLITTNAIENFRYRIIDGEVFLHDKINASVTIMRDDKTFGLSLVEFDEDLHRFNENAKKRIEKVHNTNGLSIRFLSDTIHFSIIPWISFSAVSHARGFNYPDSCPKIVFGALREENGKKHMPLSVHVHHGLMDGYHVGLFLERLNTEMQ